MSHHTRQESAFIQYVSDLVQELHKDVPRALGEFDADAIHDARVATRRLKAALDLMRPVLSDHHRKPFADVLRGLRRRLGPLRDLDVMIEHLSELPSRSKHARAAEHLRQHLLRCRDERRTKTRKKAPPSDVLAQLGAWWPVRQEMVESQEAVGAQLAESLHLQLDAFVERAASLELPAKDDGGPHQLRIAGKRLRYTLELARAAGHKLSPSVLRAFKKMQEALGQWHDFVVLTQCAMQASLDQELAYRDQLMQSAVLDLARLFMRRTGQKLERFSSLWRKHGPDITRAIRDEFPLTRAVIETQASPAPQGPPDTAAAPSPADAVAAS